VIGLSFLPNAADEEERKKRLQNLTGGPVQEAIKILSLSIPRVSGAQGIAPMPLLTARGMAGMGGGLADPVVESVMQQFGFGTSRAGQSTPAPVITPGIGDQRGAKPKLTFQDAPSIPTVPNRPRIDGGVDLPRNPFAMRSRIA
jgi:hypothetical protein